MKFCFGDIVVVENNLIGVVVKSWCPSLWSNKSPHHDVYVRYFDEIRDYSEDVMQRYMVRHKYLSDEEIVYQDNAVNNNQLEYEEIYKTFFEKASDKVRQEVQLDEKYKRNKSKKKSNKEGKVIE